jgi:5-methyltetrahydrofolate--homocysteine methyltransferase
VNESNGQPRRVVAPRDEKGSSLEAIKCGPSSVLGLQSSLLPRPSFLEAIDSGPLVLDAGMGTRLLALGLDPRSDDPAFWNLSRPGDVLAIHRRDVAAGSGAILTNTFGANRFWLRNFGQDGAIESINRRAVELAREAAGPGRFVLGDLGPTAALEEGAAVEQAAILVEAGADALFFETYRFPEADRVLRAVSRSLAAPIPLLASLWEWPNPEGPAARGLLQAGATVIGMNCQAGIEAAVAFAERLDGQVRCHMVVKPSAGSSSRSDDDPACFAAGVPRLLSRNVRLFGGCCGTSDAHVAALAAACARVDRMSLPSLAGDTR